MKRVNASITTRSLLKSAHRVAQDSDAEAILLLADVPFDFIELRDAVHPFRLLVAGEKDEVVEAAEADGLDVIRLQHDPQTRQLQLSQALLEAIADELLKSGDLVACVYGQFDKDGVDSVSLVNLAEHLSRLTARDLKRIETTVPLDTLRLVVDLAVEIGREGREGKNVGTLFVVGDHKKVLDMSHEQVHDPFKGYPAKERMIRSPRVQESVKEIAQLDGAFVISAGGEVRSAGRNLDASAEGLTLSKGLGSRHWAAAAISKQTKAIAIAVSESTGTVRIFQNGFVVLRIEPVDARGLKWSAFETEPPTG
ncbi:MAG: DNA integrity scanning protein DisA nucleotide-binding domain protein, partial [Planctomycetota bacterium]